MASLLETTLPPARHPTQAAALTFAVIRSVLPLALTCLEDAHTRAARAAAAAAAKHAAAEEALKDAPGGLVIHVVGAAAAPAAHAAREARKAGALGGARWRRPALQALLAVCVVHLALLRVGQHVIGLRHLRPDEERVVEGADVGSRHGACYKTARACAAVHSRGLSTGHAATTCTSRTDAQQ